MNMGLKRKSSLVIASKYVQSYAGDQVDLGIETDFFATPALVVVCNGAIEGVLRGGFGGVNGDGEFETER